MGVTSSRGKRPARLHSSMIGTRFSSINLRVVSRTSFSSSVSRESYWMKSTPRYFIAGIESSQAESETYERSRRAGAGSNAPNSAFHVFTGGRDSHDQYN